MILVMLPSITNIWKKLTNKDSTKKLLKYAKEIFLSIKIIIITTIRRMTDKLDVIEKTFFFAKRPNNRIIIIPKEKINSGKKIKFEILFCIRNIIIVNNGFYW